MQVSPGLRLKVSGGKIISTPGGTSGKFHPLASGDAQSKEQDAGGLAVEERMKVKTQRQQSAPAHHVPTKAAPLKLKLSVSRSQSEDITANGGTSSADKSLTSSQSEEEDSSQASANLGN